MSDTAAETATTEDQRGPRKAARVIDTDVHHNFKTVHDLRPYLPEPWQDRLGPNNWRGVPAPPYSWPMIGGVARADAATGEGPAGSDYEQMRRQLVDEYDFEWVSLISMFHPTDVTVQPEFTTALATAYNDWFIENWLDKDERFRGHVTVAAQDPHAAAREIDRVAEHPRIIQVLLPATSIDILGRSFYHPIYEAAERNELAVAFHQSPTTQPAVNLPPYYIEWHSLIFQAWQSQLLGLIFHGVFDKFPTLRVALLECGWTWVPSLLWRADQHYRSVRREVPWVKRMPTDYVRDHVRISTQPMEYPEDLSKLYTMFELLDDDSLLMFSSDYPHWDFDSPFRVFPPAFPKDVKEKILYRNAKDMYDRR